MTVKLLAEHILEFLSLKGGCTGLSESTLVKMPHCWKTHVVAHFQTYCYKLSLIETPQLDCKTFFATVKTDNMPPQIKF